jgi:integrase/recombinase XerD
MTPPTASTAPVEYAVAVDRYLAEADLQPGSRRVYRISLASWAWPLVGRMPPTGRGRRSASPPVVPLAILDQAGTDLRLADALAYRRQHAEARTVNREVSALRSAVGWWQRRRWISADPTATLRQVLAPPAVAVPLTLAQLEALFGVPAGLREQAFWHLLADCSASAEAVLTLDADAIDIRSRRARLSGERAAIEWGARTGELLSWLLAGRRQGPVFRTERRAPAGTPTADICPLSGRGRMSYRRAAEIFTEHTQALDPAGRGWTLRQLRRPGSGGQIPEPAAISNAV